MFDIRGTTWYFRPVYRTTLEYKNVDNSVVENVGDCVYAKFGDATLCFKLTQQNAWHGWIQAGADGVAGVVARIADLFFGNVDSDDEANEEIF
jgi:hypothetical protein